MTDLAQAELTQAPTAADEFADVLDDLRQLSTSTLLACRLAAGQRDPDGGVRPVGHAAARLLIRSFGYKITSLPQQ